MTNNAASSQNCSSSSSSINIDGWDKRQQQSGAIMGRKRKSFTEEERKARAEDRSLCRKHDGKDWWCVEEAKYGCFCEKHYFQQQQQARIRAEKRKLQKALAAASTSGAAAAAATKMEDSGAVNAVFDSEDHNAAVGSGLPGSPRTNIIIADSSATARNAAEGKNTVVGSSSTAKHFRLREKDDADANGTASLGHHENDLADESRLSSVHKYNPYKGPYHFVLHQSRQFLRGYTESGLFVGRRRLPTPEEDEDSERTQSDSSRTWTDPLVFPSNERGENIEDDDADSAFSNMFVLQRRHGNPHSGVSMPFEMIQIDSVEETDSEDEHDDSDSESSV